MNRRMFLAASLAAVGCTRTPRANTLRVFVYAGGHERTMREVFVPQFTALTGASVSLFAGWWEGMTKLRGTPGQPPFDLMITDATQGYPAAREGLFASIDPTQLPNTAALAPAALEHWIYRERHGLPYPDSVMTLAYRRSATQNPPVGWKDLLRPEFAGQLGLYDHFYMSLYTFAAILADSNGRPGTAHELIATQIDEVFRLAIEHRKRVKLWWPTSNDMILALNDGSVAAGNMHSPEYLQALREKPNLAACVPEHDRAMVQVFWAIPSGSPNIELAHRAIDLMFSHDMQLEFAKRGMATARPETAAMMATHDAIWKQLYPHTAEQFKNLKYYPYDEYAKNWDALTDRWTRTVLRG